MALVNLIKYLVVQEILAILLYVNWDIVAMEIAMSKPVMSRFLADSVKDILHFAAMVNVRRKDVMIQSVIVRMIHKSVQEISTTEYAAQGYAHQNV